MKEQLITEVQRRMLPYLTNEQLAHLREAMAATLCGVQISVTEEQEKQPETNVTEAFIAAKTNAFPNFLQIL